MSLYYPVKLYEDELRTILEALRFQEGEQHDALISKLKRKHEKLRKKNAERSKHDTTNRKQHGRRDTNENAS